MAGNEMVKYFLSVHFWAPALNWVIPVSTIINIWQDPKIISRNMTLALLLLSSCGVRFALRVKPKNMLLFACHAVNLGAQCVQLGRYANYKMVQA